MGQVKGKEKNETRPAASLPEGWNGPDDQTDIGGEHAGSFNAEAAQT